MQPTLCMQYKIKRTHLSLLVICCMHEGTFHIQLEVVCDNTVVCILSVCIYLCSFRPLGVVKIVT